MNKYLKNGILIILIAVLGGLLGFGVSKLLDLSNNEPRVEIKQKTIQAISQAEALKQAKFDVFVPNYFKDKKIKYYIFPDNVLHVDYQEPNSKIPVASLDIFSEKKTKTIEQLKNKQSFPFTYGNAYYTQNKDNTILWFSRKKATYLLSIKNSILPKEKQQALVELKKIAISFHHLKR
jgi:hypothetical protein